MKIWFKLLSDCAQGKKGELQSTEDQAEFDSLVKLKMAEKAEAPSDNPLGDAVSDIMGQIKTLIPQTVKETVAAEFKTVADTTKKGFEGIRLPATAKDHAEESLCGFKYAGEFYAAVKNAGQSAPVIDDRLKGWNQKQFELARSKAPQGLNTLEGADGGYLVPEVISNEILEVAFGESSLLARTDSEAINGNSLTVKAVKDASRATGSRRGGVRGYWLAEAEQFTKSKPQFREMTLKPHKLGVFYYATDEELDDAPALAPKLTRYAGEEIRFLCDDAIISGDGVGKPLGILNSPCLVTVSKESGPQTADTIVFPNLVKMYARMLPAALAGAAWYINQDTTPQLMALAFPGASGTVPAYLNGNGFPNLASAPYGMILGKPVYPIEQCPTLGDVGDIIFANMGYYKTATRGGIKSAMSIHLRFDYGETAFRFEFRVDGQPWLDSAVTPFKGTANTVSPFVALEAR